MDSRQIEIIVWRNKRARKYFKGCYPCDQIPRVNEFPALFIVNEDNRTQRGTHWTSIYLPSKDKAYYFDSFGCKPNPCISKYFENFNCVIFNHIPLQSVFSDVCGHYCIFFVLSICKGFNFNDVLRTLSKQHNPDYFVRNVVFSLMQG